METKIRILIACEESQAVTIEFRKLGFQAFSCDIQEQSGGYPEWHFKQDVFEVIENKGGTLQNGSYYVQAAYSIKNNRVTNMSSV